MEDIIDYKEDPTPERGWRKWSAGMVDAIFVFVGCFFWYFLGDEFLEKLRPEAVSDVVFVLIVFLVYRVITIGLLKKTIGMFIFRIKFLNDSMESSTIGERISAAFFVMLHGTDYYRES